MSWKIPDKAPWETEPQESKVTGLLRLDQAEGPAVGDLVTGQDGHTYRVTGLEEFGGTGRFLYALDRAEGDKP